MASNLNFNNNVVRPGIESGLISVGSKDQIDIMNGTLQSSIDVENSTTEGFFPVGSFPEDVKQQADIYGINSAAYVSFASGKKLSLNITNLWKTDLQEGKEYTISFWMYGLKASSQNCKVDSNLKISGKNYTFSIPRGNSNGWKRYQFNLMPTSSNSIGDNLITISATTSTSCKFYISNVLFEYGSEATDWNSSIREIQSLISQTRDEILLKVKDTGIDIENNKITLSADNTIISGDLNVSGVGTFLGNIIAESFETLPSNSEDLKLLLSGNSFNFIVRNKVEAYFDYNTHDGVSGVYLNVWDDSINNYKWINLSNSEMWKHDGGPGNADVAVVDNIFYCGTYLDGRDINSLSFNGKLYYYTEGNTYHTDPKIGSDGSKYKANGYFIQQIKNIEGASVVIPPYYAVDNFEMHLVYYIEDGKSQYKGRYFLAKSASYQYNPHNYTTFGPYIYYNQTISNNNSDIIMKNKQELQFSGSAWGFTDSVQNSLTKITESKLSPSQGSGNILVSNSSGYTFSGYSNWANIKLKEGR